MTDPARPMGVSPRAVRLSPRPIVSIVVVSGGELSLLKASLASLLPQRRDPAFEIIVVSAGLAADEAERLKTDYPACQFLFASPDSEISQLKAQGMGVAEGDIVAFVDDRRPVTWDRIAKLAGTDDDGTGAQPKAVGPAERPRDQHVGERATSPSHAAVANLAAPSASESGREKKVDG